MSSAKTLPHEAVGKIAGRKLPDLLLPYQTRVNMEMETASVLFVEKSRRIGITWGVASNAVLTAAVNKADGGMDVFYIGFNLDMTREFIDTCASWARAFGHAAAAVEEFIFPDDNDREIRAYRIKFSSGFEIVALTSRPRSLRGRQGFVIIDEAAFHDDLKELMKAALALLVWGGKVLVISTHDGVDNQFNQYIEDSRKGKNKYKIIRIDLDDALRDGLFKRICLTQGKTWSQDAELEWRQELVDLYGEGADEELFCIPAMSGGAYIPGTLIEARMVDSPVIRHTCNKEFVHLSEHLRRTEIEEWCERELKPLLDQLAPNFKSYLGEDFGRTGDLTVLWIFQRLQDTTRHTPFTVELSNVPFRQQLQIIWYILDRLPRFMSAAFDARGNGSQVAEETMQRYGRERIHCVMLTKMWYLQNVPPFKAGFEDGTITVPRDADIKDDIRAIVVADGVPQIIDKRTTDKKGQQRHGDSAIAAIMAWFAAMNEVVEYAYQPINVQRKDRMSMTPVHDGDHPRLPPRRFSKQRGTF